MIQSGYLPKDSFMHRLDPRTKLFLLVLVAVAFFFPVSVPIYALYLLLPVAAVLLTLGLRELWIPVRTILPLLILVAVLTPPFHRSGDLLFSIGGVELVTSGGLEETSRLLLRFTGITVSFFLFFRSTDIETLILTLRWYRLPYSFALVLTIAFRYIPYIASLYRAISDAHRLRSPVHGGRGGKNETSLWKGAKRRFSRIFPTLVSVMIHSVKTIPSLSMTLETRGFGRSERRTALHSLPPLSRRPRSLGTAVVLTLLLLLPLWP